LRPAPLLLSLLIAAIASRASAQQPAAAPVPAPPPQTQTPQPTAPSQPPQTQTPAEPQTQTPTPADEEKEPTRKWPPFGLAFGAGVRVTAPTGDSTTAFVTPTPVARFVPRAHRSGLVPAIRLGLGKQRTTLVETTAAGQTQVGSVYVRPLTFGLGWSQPVAHRVSMVFSGSAGYSWNGFDPTDNGRGHPQLLLPSSVVNISNSFAWELSSRAWFDLTPRVSFLGGLSFLATRPDLTLADGSTRAWSANQIRIEAGIAFTVLKPLRARRHH
jgi:hypothetical protein